METNCVTRVAMTRMWPTVYCGLVPDSRLGSFWMEMRGLGDPACDPGRSKASDNKALDAEPPIASFVKSMLIGGGPVNAGVRRLNAHTKCPNYFTSA